MNKDQIRSKMPPTTRNFEARTNHLAEQLEWVKDTLSDMKDDHEYQDALIASNTEYALFASLSALQTDQRAPRILLAGWYGADNYGDELMMQTVLSYLPKELRENTTVLLWENKDYALGKIDPLVKTLHYPPTTYGIQALSQLFDVLVWGGGAIIDDVQYSDRPNNHATGNIFIRLSNRMIAQGKPVYCISLSASDSLNNAEYLAQLQTIIDRAAYFSLRDPYSRDTLIAANIDTSRIQLDSDIVFANKALQKHIQERANRTQDAKELPIGLVLHCFDELTDLNYRLICDVASIAKDQGLSSRIMLIPFYHENESDKLHLERLAERYSEEHSGAEALQIAPYSDELASSPLLECGLIISCRYHASLIAGCLGIPFVAVCNDTHNHYPNKTKYLLDQFYPGGIAEKRMVCISDYSKECLAKVTTAQLADPTKPQTIKELCESETRRLITALSFLPTTK